MNEAVLVTGASGFLGSNLVKKLIANRVQVIAVVRDKTNAWRIEEIRDRISFFNIDTDNANELFKNNKISTIVHCATDYGRKNKSPFNVIEANLLLPLRFLELAKYEGVRCFINTDTILDRGVNYYSLSKSQFCEWLKLYSSGMVCINIELEHFFGPFDDDSKFVTWIIHSLLKSVDVIDLTPGEQERYFVYIDDVVSGFLKILDNAEMLGNGYFNYQVGSLESIRIKDIVKLVKKLTGNVRTELNFGAQPYRNNEIMKPSLDLSGLQKIGWSPNYSLIDGLSKTIAMERECLGI